MIRKLNLIFAVLLCCFATSRANEEYNIVLDNESRNKVIVEEPYGNVTIQLLESKGEFSVSVSLENTTPSQAVLLFKRHTNESELKRETPKIEFEKTYPGSKGRRSVDGCEELERAIQVIIPQATGDLFTIPYDASAPLSVTLPVYLAKYNPKKLLKKGAYSTDYKILSEDILHFNIEASLWDENNPDYVGAKVEIGKLILSLEEANLCNNSKHKPSLEEQLVPYNNKRDSLLVVIRKLKESNHSKQAVESYTVLMDSLNNMDFNKYAKDCRKHGDKVGGHKCNYCNLGAQQIYHQLDDLYQQMRTGKITKAAAQKKARELYNCYNANKKRKKDSGFSEKITRFYNRINE